MAASKKKVSKKTGAKVAKGPAKAAAAGPELPKTATVHEPVIPQTNTKVDVKAKAALRNYVGQMKAKGAGNVVFANEAISTYALRRPSGIMQLDLDTGGGLPAGGMSTLAGPDGTGKSELLYLYFVQNQRIYGEDSRIALAHTEGQFDFWRAKRMGLQISIPKMLIEERRSILASRGLPDLTPDQVKYLQHGVGDFILIGGDNGEQILDNMLSAIASNAFSIVGVDSLQGLIPKANADKEMDEIEKRAAFATMITKFTTHYVPLCSGLVEPNYTTLIGISQIRANPDKGTNPYAPEFIVQLAKALKHYHLIEVTLTTGQQIRKTVARQDTTIGKEMKWKITKGKAGAHDNVFGSTSFIYPEYTSHGQSIDTVSSAIVAGVRYGVIHETPSAVYIVRGGKHAEGFDPVQNLAMMETMMRLDPEYENAIRQEILLAANINCRYR
jgi:RecA/RadA recombinase